MIGPLVKNGDIGDTTNLALAVVLGFFFGFALQRGGFTDSRKIGGVFYLKDLDVPVVMLTAIATGAIGLWGLSLLGLLDIAHVYLLPTYLAPMAVAGVMMGVGMVVGGFCPGTAIASASTGKLDALVFLGGFLIGVWTFGDLFPFWEDFYQSDYRGVFRLDQLLGIPLGTAVLLAVVFAIVSSLTLRWLQRLIWKLPKTPIPARQKFAGGLALVLASIMAFFPTQAFFAITETAGSVAGWRTDWQDPHERVVLSPLEAGRLLYDYADRVQVIELVEARGAAPRFPGARAMTLAQLRASRFPKGSIILVAGTGRDDSVAGMKWLRQRQHLRAFATSGGLPELVRYYLAPLPGDLLARLSDPERTELYLYRAFIKKTATPASDSPALPREPAL